MKDRTEHEKRKDHERWYERHRRPRQRQPFHAETISTQPKSGIWDNLSGTRRQESFSFELFARGELLTEQGLDPKNQSTDERDRQTSGRANAIACDGRRVPVVSHQRTGESANLDRQPRAGPLRFRRRSATRLRID